MKLELSQKEKDLMIRAIDAMRSHLDQTEQQHHLSPEEEETLEGEKIDLVQLRRKVSSVT